MTTPVLLAEFGDAEALLGALRRARAAGLTPVDAFTPFSVEGLHELLGHRRTRIRYVMFLAAILAAGAAYALEWTTSVLYWPLDSGSRPLNSWVVFLLVPFEWGVLAAAVSGFAAFLLGTGLPRLHHPVFAVEGFERASLDRFFLAVWRADSGREDRRARALLESLGALSVREAEL